MIPLILRFAQCCRSDGLAVSTAEVLDAAGHLDRIDTTDEAQFRTVLRANFVKSRRDQGRFDRLYEMFFHDGVPPGAMPGTGKPPIRPRRSWKRFERTRPPRT